MEVPVKKGWSIETIDGHFIETQAHLLNGNKVPVKFALVDAENIPSVQNGEVAYSSGLALQISIGMSTGVISGRDARRLARTILEEWMHGQK
jgi:hypothetical protein